MTAAVTFRGQPSSPGAGFMRASQLHRHPIDRRFLLTEGVMYVAKQGAAEWLIDTIVLAQGQAELVLPDFQVWRLDLDADSSGRLTCRDEAGVLRFTRVLYWTDCPYTNLELWLDRQVLGLPSEASD